MTSLSTRRAPRGRVYGLCLFAGMAVLAAAQAQAASIVVTTLNDASEGATGCTGTGACNLRDAVLKANRSVGADTITFASGLSGTLLLTLGELAISDSVTITGPGASVVTLNGHQSRVFDIAYTPTDDVPIDVAISRFTFVNGRSNSDGGAVFGDNVNLSLSDCVFSSNHSEGYGGAVATQPTVPATLSVQRCDFDGNSAAVAGGALVAQDTSSVTLDTLHFIDNSSTHAGGAVVLLRIGNGTLAHGVFQGNHAGTFSLLPNGHGGGALSAVGDKITSTIGITDSRFETNVTDHGWGGALAFDTFGAVILQRLELSGNSAGNNGGAIRATAASITLENSTLSGNQATGVGGAIALETTGDAALTGVTAVGNSAATGGAFSIVTGTSLTALNSVIANNTASSAADVSGALRLRYSLLKNVSGAQFTSGSGNNLAAGTDPQLGALGVNGGASLTLLPATTSPLVNAGDPGTSGGTDQRGLSRVASGRVDIGAAERQTPEDVIFRNGFE